MSRKVKKKILGSVSYIGITMASNGQIAIDLLQKDKYDIILISLQMPVMNG